MRGRGGAVQIITISGDVIEREKRLPHGQRIAQIGPRSVGISVHESAVGKTPMRDNPIGRALCFSQRRLIAKSRILLAQSGDHPSVLARIDVLVNAGNAQRPPFFVAELGVALVLFAVMQVRVLRNIKCSFGRRQKRGNIPAHRLRRGCGSLDSDWTRRRANTGAAPRIESR